MPYLIRPRQLRTEKQIVSDKARACLAEFDQLIEPIDVARGMTMQVLRRPLNRVPRSERGVEWTERVVIAYCLTRQRSARVRSLRKDIIQYWEGMEQPDRAQAFAARVDLAIGPHNLHKGEYFIQFGGRDGHKPAAELEALIARLQGMGLSVFVNSGTLLGAVREQSFIGHDDDIDLGVMLKATTEKDAARELLKIYSDLNAHDGIKIKTSFNSPVLKIKMPSDIVVDLFPTWISDGRVYIWPHTYGDLDESDLLPMGREVINGHAMPAPANPRKMLAINYGENWHTPDSDFKFPWAEARVKFHALLSTYWRAVRILAIRNTLFGKRKTS